MIIGWEKQYTQQRQHKQGFIDAFLKANPDIKAH